MNFQYLPIHRVIFGRCTCGKVGCSSPGKHPRTRNGVLDAKPWKPAQLNVAIRTGEASGIFVLDVDEKSHLSWFDATFATLMVNTPRGIHLYFRWVDGVTNRAGLTIGESACDVRGHNGYVVCPPSDGYSWRNSKPISPAPEWLIREVQS